MTDQSRTTFPIVQPQFIGSARGYLSTHSPPEMLRSESQIRAPTLVIAGYSDVLIPPENGRILAEKIPSAEFRTIEGAGHLFWISHPNETFSEVAGFLEGNEIMVVHLELVDISKKGELDYDLWDSPLDPSCNQKRYCAASLNNSTRNINQIKEHHRDYWSRRLGQPSIPRA